MEKNFRETLPLTIITGEKVVSDEQYKDKSLCRVSIEGGVEIIGAEAFANCGIKILLINDDVKYIEEKAFINNNMESLVVSSKVDYIGKEAFANCGIKYLVIKKDLYDKCKEAFIGNCIDTNNIKFID